MFDPSTKLQTILLARDGGNKPISFELNEQTQTLWMIRSGRLCRMRLPLECFPLPFCCLAIAISKPTDFAVLIRYRYRYGTSCH